MPMRGLCIEIVREIHRHLRIRIEMKYLHWGKGVSRNRRRSIKNLRLIYYVEPPTSSSIQEHSALHFPYRIWGCTRHNHLCPYVIQQIFPRGKRDYEMSVCHGILTCRRNCNRTLDIFFNGIGVIESLQIIWLDNFGEYLLSMPTYNDFPFHSCVKHFNCIRFLRREAILSSNILPNFNYYLLLYISICASNRATKFPSNQQTHYRVNERKLLNSH